MYQSTTSDAKRSISKSRKQEHSTRGPTNNVAVTQVRKTQTGTNRTGNIRAEVDKRIKEISKSRV